jgi:hypothetical protein
MLDWERDGASAACLLGGSNRRCGIRKGPMGKARIINAIFWLWLWLSDVFSPVATDADFWTEKATQLFRFNESINDPARFVGNAYYPGFVVVRYRPGLATQARAGGTAALQHSGRPKFLIKNRPYVEQFFGGFCSGLPANSK